MTPTVLLGSLETGHSIRDGEWAFFRKSRQGLQALELYPFFDRKQVQPDQSPLWTFQSSRGEDVAMAHRILIIDDEDDIREVAALSLETVAGWDVAVANSGAQGLVRAIEFKPEAILLDVMMPEMDGPSTFRELRKNPATARIPVVLLTAKVQPSDQRTFADLGVEAVLFKPFDPMTLATQIAEVLGWN
jgi:CheY-like chemotaxis protein